MTIKKQFSIGLTEAHGMAIEQSKFPPTGIKYSFLEYKNNNHIFFKSPMKGFMCSFKDQECDAVEAILNPAKTSKPWFYSLAMYQEALAFSFLGIPIPRTIRAKYMERLFLKDNFKSLLFWSEAGMKTMTTYGNVTSPKLIEKAKVVYPAVRKAPKELILFNKKPMHILFNGNFFIKGGANVVDAFEILQDKYPNLKLRLCCDKNIDFNTGDHKLKEHYLTKINSNNSIKMGRVKRDTFISEILPNTDIYILPTYGDAFGFAILEAMALGIPVISTNYMAMPEMITHGKTGYMIDISQYNCLEMFKGCYVRKLPVDFSNYITENLVKYMDNLLSSYDKRYMFGQNSLETTNSKFSFERRANKMLSIYQETLN